MRAAWVSLCLVLGLSTASGCSCSKAQSTGPAPSASASGPHRPDKRLTKRLDHGIERATKYIASRADSFDPRLAVVLAYPQRKFAPKGLPSMADRATKNESDPGARHFADLFRRLVDPKATVDRQSIEAEDSEIDRATATALYCDKIGKPDSLLPMLATLTERPDEYSLPHAMMATGWATENGCLPADLGKLLRDRQAELVETRMGARRESLIGDALIESVLFLYYIGERNRVKDEWVDAVLDAQLTSGGWSNKTANEDDHTTALAFWLLLEAAHPEVPASPWILRE